MTLPQYIDEAVAMVGELRPLSADSVKTISDLAICEIIVIIITISSCVIMWRIWLFLSTSLQLEFDDTDKYIFSSIKKLPD